MNGIGFPGQPRALPGDGERGDAPRPGTSGGAREHGVDVGLRRIGDEDLLAAQPEAGAVGFGHEAERGDVGTGARLGHRKGGDRLTRRDPGDPNGDDLVTARRKDRMGAQPLERERGLGLRRVPRQALPHQAEGQRRDLPARREHLRHQPVGREGGDQLPVDLAGFATLGDRREDVVRQRLASRQDLAMGGGEMRIGGAHEITATPTSSTIALGSKSSVTPTTAIAG